MRTLNALLAITLVASSLAAVAQQPPAELRKLDFMAGSWKCSGDVFETPMAPAHKSSGTVEVKWSHDGHWLAFTYAEKKSAAAPMPVTFSGYIGFDPEQKQYVLGGVDSLGGYNTEASMGMENDAFVFTGPWHMGTMTANSRDTFTRKSDRELVHIGEVEMNGQWVKFTQDDCMK